MDELGRILDELADGDPDDDPAVLITVVRVRGSAYRGPGARRLIRRDGSGLGLISGGCLEADLARRAWQLTASGRPALIRYDSTDPDDAWAFGLGCRGVVDLMVERVEAGRPPGWVAFVRDRLARREPAALARVVAVRDGEVGGPPPARVGSFVAVDGTGDAVHDLADPGLARRIADRAGAVLDRDDRIDDELTLGGLTLLVERVEPPPTLIVCGAGPDALPLVRLARELGWSVAVVDGRHRPGTAARFAEADEVFTIADADRLARLAARRRASAVVMTHDVAEDAQFLAALLAGPIGYVGLLGPGHRARRVLDAAGPLDDRARARLRSPVGLDLGGEAPSAVALAIVAEIQAVLANRAGGPLRDRGGPIHDRGGPLP